MTNSGSQPPAGFYPNPENPSGPQRWWDGQTWTDFYETPAPPPPPQGGATPPTMTQTPSAAPSTAQPAQTQYSPTPTQHVPTQSAASPAPQSPVQQAGSGSYGGIPPYNPDPVQAPGTFPSLGDTVQGGWDAIKTYWQPLIAICVPFIALPATLYIMAFFEGFNGVVINVTEREITGGSDNALLWNLLMLITPILSTIGMLSVAALLIGADDNTGDRTTFAAAGPAIKQGFSRFPISILWVLALTVAGYLAMVIAVLALVINPLLGVLVLFGLMAGLLFLTVKWVFSIFALAEGENVPFAKSAAVSNQRWWQVFGHIIVLGLIAGLINVVVMIPGNLMMDAKVETAYVESLDQYFIGVASDTGPLGYLGYFIFSSIAMVLVVGIYGGGLARMYRAVHPGSQPQLQQQAYQHAQPHAQA